MPGTSGPDGAAVVVVVEVGLGLGFGTVVVVGRGPVVATVWTSVVDPVVVVVGPVVEVVGSVDVVDPSPGFGRRLPACNSTGGRRFSGTSTTAAEATTTATTTATAARLRLGRAGTSSLGVSD
jgi:hypothetical protein